MLKMVIKFDEEKMEKNSEYSLSKVYDYINNLVKEKNLRVCENGIYVNGDDEDKSTSAFMVIATVLLHKEWIKYAKEWLWYEDSDVPEDLLKTFKIAG